MNNLENTYNKCLNIENKFTKKKILFIPSESYDVCTIGIIEGLNKLGFEILVYKKNNINSWFCNKIIYNLDNIEDSIDFVLSNLHWGTRWTLYNKLKHNVPYILIDGDDRIHGNNISNWKDKYNNYIKNYKLNPSDEIKNKEISPYRWMEQMNDYKPDLIFMANKYKINKNCLYLPTCILDNYIKYLDNNNNININNKKYDIIHIPGPGEYRHNLKKIINIYLKKYNIFNENIYGEKQLDERIKDYCDLDNNIHSWHRWNFNKKYCDILKNSKINIISPVDKYNAPGGVGIKRITEALMSGSYILYHQQPDVDDSNYSYENICNYCKFEFENYNEMIQKCDYLLNNPEILKNKQKKMYENTLKYFTSVPITRYFLYNIFLNKEFIN